jgi:LacI family transcriptional regulator
MASIFDVAQQANVSPSTVSLVLNHRQRVSPATRDRVDEIIRRLGYQPSRRRTPVPDVRPPALRLAFLYTLETMFDRGMSSYCREIINGLQTELGDIGSLSILRGVEHADHDSILHQQLEARELDGVILFGPETRNGYLERCEAAKLPMVVFNRMPTHGQFSCVTLDYYGGARLAANHVYELGHRKIASLTGDSAEKWLAKQIRQGLVDTLGKHKIEPMSFDPTGMPLDNNVLPTICRRIMNSGATALITGDVIGRRCADALANLGVRVPEDISIIGFDDLGLKTKRDQAITTIGYDKRQMGIMAARMLTQLIQGRNQVCWMSHAVPTYLVAGETTAPLGKTAAAAGATTHTGERNGRHG